MTMTATPAYQFFVSSGIPRPADERMRSHAIKAALRMRKQGFGDAEGGLAGRSSASSNLTLRSHAQLKGRFRAVPSPTSKAAPAQSLNSSKKGLVEVDLQTRWQDSTNITQSLDGYQQVSTTRRRESIPNSIQKAKLDPFDSLPVENNWRVNLLLKHFLTGFSLNLTTVDPQRSWFSHALTDPLIMHTTLALSGAERLSNSMVVDHNIRQEVVRQKLEAISIIKSHLDGQTLVQSIIAGVATLANVACFEGAFSEADLHMKAVRQVIDAGGVVEMIQDNFLISRAVIWTDLQTASALGRAPYFPLLHAHSQTQLPLDLLEKMPRIKLDALEQEVEDADTVEVFALLRHVIWARDTHKSPHVIRILMNTADWKMSECLVGGASEHPRTSLEVALLLGAHVFLYAVLRKVPPAGILLQTLLARLELHLKSFAPNPESSVEIHAWLWLLFVGLVVESSNPRVRSNKFALQLEVFCRSTAILDRGFMVETLKDFLWAEAACIEPLEGFLDLLPASRNSIMKR
ncbi:hypothetical protein B0A52_07743 [Exophiala mesophila]|uniref:Tachykinin family protein n=1 Tax=Exophiala mesophila TaxID=212818 RepID=A0A438MXY6_EXOME|nr:hypothetical protein B0A52_07743 [Exophiala mesophila]